MNRILKLLAPALIAGAAFTFPGAAESLVLLHTNDTHSNIDPDRNGVGGILQRKAVIDSVRKAEKNVLLVDAGDIVQGTLFFKFFRGDVEYPLFNMMDYDVRILGNHEFDNGLEELARHYKDVKGARLSANYDFSATPLRGMFEPYVIREIGAKKIGILGLNVDPASLIAAENTEGMKFSPIIATAERTAALLRNEKKCDLVVAVTHIGYGDVYGRETDVDLARASRDIDIIIGGHSHTTVDPSRPEENPSIVMNAAGRPVLVAQTGKYGRNLGYIRLDLDRLAQTDARDYDYRLIPVTDRFPEESLDRRMKDFLLPYRQKIDSISSRVAGRSAFFMENGKATGPLANFAGDFALEYGRHVVDSLNAAGAALPQMDFAVMNVGGIRQNMPEGIVTEGDILTMFPFSNRFVIVEQKGSDILSAMQAPAKKGGEAVSGNVRGVMDEEGNLLNLLIDGRPVDPEKIYVMATIDYVANGNDNMDAFARGRRLWTDPFELCAPVMEHVRRLYSYGLEISPDPTPRFVKPVR